MFEEIILWDNAILHAAQAVSFQPLDILMAGITLIGNPMFWIAAVAFLYWQGRENDSFHLANLVAISAICVGALKWVFARPRPSANDFRVVSIIKDTFGTMSFPSGHSTLITANFFYLKNFLQKNAKIIFAIIVILVAFSRLYLGMHYITDVAAGIVLGAVIGWGYYKFAKKIEGKRLHFTKSEDKAAIIALLAASVLLVGFLQSVPLSTVLVGYYIGFFALKEIGLHERELSRSKFLTKQGIGFVVLSGIMVYGFADPLFSIIWFGLGGLWISCLWPFIFEKTITHD